MATITLTVEGSAVGTLVVPTVLDEFNSDRLMAYLAAVHGTKQVLNLVTGQMETVPCTPQEMVESYWAGIVRGTLANVEQHDKTTAAQAAAAAVVKPVATINGVPV